MHTLYLIRGVPGSGKSTFAQQLLKHGIVDYVFEADQFFMRDVEYKFDASKLKHAHNWCQENTRTFLLHEMNIAVSNTTTTEKEVAVYQQIAEETGAKFVSIVVESRHDGTNVHGVPPEKVQQMRQRFSVKV